MAEKNKDQPTPSTKLQTKSFLRTITRSPMLKHKSIASKTIHTKQVKHSSHRTRSAFKYQSKTIFPSRESPHKKAPVRYRDLLDVIYDKSGDDQKFFYSDINGTNYHKCHNTQSPMKEPRLSSTVSSPLKSKMPKTIECKTLSTLKG